MEKVNNRQRVLNLIAVHHKSTSGHCGLNFPKIGAKLTIGNSILKNILNDLELENEIKKRKGIHGTLIFLKNK